MNKKVVLSVLATAVVASMAASAFAAPKTGLYIGGNVKKFYSNNTLLNMTKDARATYKNELKTIGFQNLVYVNVKGQGATIQEMINLGTKVAMADPLKKSDFLDSYGVVQNDGTVSGTEEPGKLVDPTTPGELKVESVSAINASQIEVEFSAPVTNAGNTLFDATSKVITTANLTVTPLGSASPISAGDLQGSLSEDGKTLTITNVDDTDKFAGQYAVYLKKDVVASKNDANQFAPEFNGTVTVNDTTKPVLSDVKYGVNTATVTFSEPLASVGTVSLDGVALASPAGYDFTPGTNSLTIKGLVSGKVYNLAITGAKDKANNLISPNPTTKALSLSADTVKPTVAVSVKDTTVTVKFNEELQLQDIEGDSSADDFAKVTIGSNVVYLKAANQDATDKTKFTYDAAALVTGGFLNTTVKVEGFKDLSGNAGDAVTTNATLTKDAVAPAYVSASTKDNKFIVKFNEDAEADATLTTVDVKFTSTDNVVKTVAGANLDTANIKGKFDANNNGYDDEGEENYLVLPVATTVTDLVGTDGKLLPGTYEVTLAIGTVADKVTPTANKNTAAIKFNVTVTGSSTSAPVVRVDAATTVEKLNTPGTLIVGFNKEMGASALVAGNYKIDGVALPSTVKPYFDGNKQTVAIELPEGFVAVSGDRQVEVSNVTDKDGNTLETGYTSDVVSLTENIKPVANKVELVDAQNLTLSFSEALATLPATVSGIKVKVNGTEIALDGTTPFALVAGDNTKVTIKAASATAFKLSDAITVEVAGSNVTDANKNVVKDGNVSK